MGEKHKNLKQRGGFTIIEVVLVLAIAGLIMIMVFVALPSMQKAQRNTQRKEDMARLVSQIELYMKNNNGKLDDNAKCSQHTYDCLSNDAKRIYDVYMADDFIDPSTGEKYYPVLWTAGGNSDCDVYGTLGSSDKKADCWGSMKVGEFQLDSNAVCAGEYFDDRKGTSRYFAIRIRLEGGAASCLSNYSE